MSYGFGTTLGTSAADRIQLSLTPTTGARTYAFRGAINASGGGGIGRFMDAEPNTTTTEAWFREASSNRILYNRKHSSAGAAWSCPCQADVSAEHTYSISVDGSGTASPTMYFDGVSQTVTVGTTAVGSASAITAPIFLGNRSPDWGRGYDGTQRSWAAWNTILTAQEHLDFHNGADPLSNSGWTSGTAPTGLVLYMPMETNAVDTQGNTVTITGARLIAAQADATVTMTGQSYALTQGALSASVGSNVTLDLIGQTYTITQGALMPALATTTLVSPVDRGNISLASSSITNATTSTPTVTMQVRRMVNEQSGDAQAKNYFFYGATTNVSGKTPTYKMKYWSSSSHSATTELFKFHYTTPLESTYKPVWSYDARTWNYFDNVAWNADGLYLDFYNNADFTSDTVYVASAFPWQTDKTAEWIATLSSSYLSQPASAVAFGGDPYQFGITTARTNELGETIAPVKTYALKISSGGLDPNGHQKRKILLTAGTHAGEDLGNWVLKGATELLLTEDTKAQLARLWCDFYIYPHADPSGRRGGHWRSHFDSNLLTADGNRYWGLSTLANTVLHTNAMLLDTGGSYSASMDFHSGHATPPYYVTQTQTSNDTWHAAISTYIPGITRSIGDIANSMMGWSENTIGAKICITPEFNADDNYTTAQIEAWGASHIKALADVAATNYLYSASVSVALSGQSYALSQGLVGKSLEVGLQGQYISFSQGSVSAVSGSDYFITLEGQEYIHSQGSLSASVSYPTQNGTVTLSQESIDALATAIAAAMYAHPNAVTEGGIVTAVWNKVL